MRAINSGKRAVARSTPVVALLPSAMPVRVKTGAHFSPAELSFVNRLQKKKNSANEILAAMTRRRKNDRKKRKDTRGPPSIAAIYRLMSGKTYLDENEQRGRPKQLGNAAVRVYNQVRRSLQKNAVNEYIVTWDDIAKEGAKVLRQRGLLKRGESGWSADWLRKKMGEQLGVGKRPAPERIGRDTGDRRRHIFCATRP